MVEGEVAHLAALLSLVVDEADVMAGVHGVGLLANADVGVVATVVVGEVEGVAVGPDGVLGDDVGHGEVELLLLVLGVGLEELHGTVAAVGNDLTVNADKHDIAAHGAAVEFCFHSFVVFVFGVLWLYGYMVLRGRAPSFLAAKVGGLCEMGKRR